jgi:hypothetical protein
MSVNNSYRILRPGINKPVRDARLPARINTIDIPLEIKWDFSGREDAIQRYQDEVIKEIIGSPGPFEISRYSHKEYGQDNLTKLNYDFYFYNSSSPVSASTNPSDWVNSYLFPLSTPSGFSITQLYYFQKPFRNSFFKLDFYDTPDTRTQKNYFTIILPTQQGITETATISPYIPDVQIKKPSMFLDFVGDKEGFFIYWLRTPEFVSLDTFHMSCKFFDARLGVFVRMMTVPQADPLLPDKFIFDTDKFFYRKVKLNYVTKKYEIFDSLTNLRVGNGTPINWYEYINP